MVTEISDWNDLDNIRNYLGEDYRDKEFVLKNDIDSSTDGYSTHVSNPSDGWEPIGDGTFEGSFQSLLDGNGYTISDLIVSGQGNGGLFNAIDFSSSIKNLNFENADISGNEEFGANTGVIAGVQTRGEIFNCTIINSTVSSKCEYVGGVVGKITGGSMVKIEVESCDVEYTGSNFDTYVGGITGGRVPNVSKVSVSDSSISGYDEVGGVVGYNDTGIIEDSYVINSSVSSSDNLAGGIVGFQYRSDDGTYRCYFVGEVSSENTTGPIDAISSDLTAGDPEVKNCYWDEEKSTLLTDGQEEYNQGAGGTPLTTEEMTGVSAENNMSGFDFTDVWKTTNQYPELQFQDVVVKSNFIFEKGLSLILEDIVSNNYVKQEGINISDTGNSKFSFISGNGIGLEIPEINPSPMWVQTRSISAQWQINLNNELSADTRFIISGSSVQNGNLIRLQGDFIVNGKTELKGEKNNWLDGVNGSGSATCCIRDGKVYALYNNGNLYRYDLSSGARDYEKSVQSDNAIAGPPIVVNGYLYYIIRRSSGWYIVQAEKSTGSTINTALLNNPAGMVSVHNQRIVVGTKSGLEFFDGSLNRLTTIGSDGAHMLIVENDTAFTQGRTTTDDGEVIISWNLDSMTKNWSKEITTQSNSFDLKTPIALGPDNVYTVVKKDNECLLYAVSRNNGEKEWQNKLGNESLTPVGVNYFDDLAFVTGEKVQDSFDGEETVYKGNAVNRYTGETYNGFNSSTSGDFTGGGPYYNTLPFLKDDSYTGQDSLSSHGIYHNDNWNPW